MTPTSEFPKLLDLALQDVQSETRTIVDRYALSSYPSWGYDESKAFLTFTNGVDQFTVLAQLVGFWNPDDSTWHWAWDDATLHERVTRSARSAREWGKVNEIELLTTAKIPADETLAWKLTAFAAKLTGCPGVYRCRSGTSFLHFAFAVPPT